MRKLAIGMAAVAALAGAFGFSGVAHADDPGLYGPASTEGRCTFVKGYYEHTLGYDVSPNCWRMPRGWYFSYS